MASNVQSITKAAAARFSCPLEPALPFAYMQSAFYTGNPADDTHILDHDGRKTLVRNFQRQNFTGGEIFFGTLETEVAMADIRDMNSAIAEVALEDGTDPFFGLWILGRMPGFSWPENVTQQPASWRSQALLSNGSLYGLAPPNPSDPAAHDYIFDFNGHFLDITNDEAVTALLENVNRTFQWDGPSETSVGPLIGSLLLSEAKLSDNYWSCSDDLPDFVPRDADTGGPPLIGYGDPGYLCKDYDPTISFWQPPKRYMPLQSESARDSFVAFAAARGVYDVVALPADILEFNADVETVTLPPWIEFVDYSPDRASREPQWLLWEDWVYETWFCYVDRVITTVLEAQRGNSLFNGAFVFQLPGWYSIRQRSEAPVSYVYLDHVGNRQSVEGEVLADWYGYEMLNPVQMGQDLEQFVAAPWFRGLIHEASHGVHVPLLNESSCLYTTFETIEYGFRRPNTSASDEFWTDRCYLASEEMVHFLNAQGTLAQEICHEAGALFGLFARAAAIGGNVADTTTPQQFEQAWRYLTDLMTPDVVCSLSAPRFIPRNDSSLGEIWSLLWADHVEKWHGVRRWKGDWS